MKVNEHILESLLSLVLHTTNRSPFGFPTKELWLDYAPKANSLQDVQLPMQNCINLQYFIVHYAHGVKAYQVTFPMQLTACHLDFPIRSNGQNMEDCSEAKQISGIHLL